MSYSEIYETIELPENENVSEWVAFHLDYFMKACNAHAKETEDVCVGCYGNVVIGGHVLEYETDFVKEELDAIQRDFSNAVPKQPCEPFSAVFQLVAQNTAERLLLLFAHLNEHHDVLQNPALFDSILTHFACFVREYDLIPEANFFIASHVQALQQWKWKPR